MHHYPHFFEEKMKEHRQKLKEIENHAWKRTRSNTKQTKLNNFTVLSNLLALIGLKG